MKEAERPTLFYLLREGSGITISEMTEVEATELWSTGHHWIDVGLTTKQEAEAKRRAYLGISTPRPEGIERGKRRYEECVRARCPSATLEWQQDSTPLCGPSEGFSVAVSMDGHRTALGPVSFDFLETSTEAQIGEHVDVVMN